MLPQTKGLRQHDLRLFRRLWEHLKKGGILLGDRAWGEYTTLAGLPLQGVEVVARLHARRKVDFRQARRLEPRDGLFTWAKGGNPSEILKPPQWRQWRAQVTVRVIRFAATIRGWRGHRVTLVTTLLDPQPHPAHENIALYARQWRLELCLRDLKTTMGLEQLRCKSPNLAEKELLACLVAPSLHLHAQLLIRENERVQLTFSSDRGFPRKERRHSCRLWGAWQACVRTRMSALRKT